MISRFLRYAEKVFDLRECLSTVRDSRPKPRISSCAIFVSAMTMFLTRRRSLNALEPALRQPKRLEGFAGKRMPSADSIGAVLAVMATGPLREMLSKLVHRLGRNKALKTVWPLRAAAIDGHEFFPGRSRRCDACRTRTIKTKKGDVTEYYHLGVVFTLIDDNLALLLPRHSPSRPANHTVDALPQQPNSHRRYLPGLACFTKTQDTGRARDAE